jgi:hypothetical protein
VQVRRDRSRLFVTADCRCILILITATQAQVHELFRTDHLQAYLKGRAVYGGYLATTSQGFALALTIIMTVVMARLLTPRDLGLLVMVTAITAFSAT